MNMVRLKQWFVLVIAVASLASGPAASGQEKEPWQKDWRKFEEAIAPYAREGAIERTGNVLEFNRVFSKEVEWAGKLKKFYFNGVAKFLKLEMQPIRVPLQDGSTIEFSELSIWCGVEKSGCEGWSEELVGEEVIFRTKLINRTRGVQPVVRVLRTSGDDRIILIETYGAELVRIVSK